MDQANAVNKDPFKRLTSSEIDSEPLVEGKPYYDTDLNIFKYYNPDNPNEGSLKYEQFGVNNEGVVKINGYFPTPISCTFDSSTDIINATAHPMVNNDQVSFKPGTGSLPAEIIEDKVYFVINTTVNTFQISETVAGPVFDFTDNGTAGTVFYDLSSTASKQSIALTGTNTGYLFYPNDSKLEVSSSTDWPPNNTQLDSDFYDFGQPAGTFTGDTTIGTNTIINMNSTTNLTEGMIIVATGIPTGTAIVSVDSATQITISENATATNPGISLDFYNNRFLENNVNLQSHLFRVRTNFTQPASINIINMTLMNPVSGFMLVSTANIAALTSGSLTFDFTTIADSQSIGVGYIFFMESSNAITFEIEDFTSISLAKQRKQ